MDGRIHHRRAEQGLLGLGLGEHPFGSKRHSAGVVRGGDHSRVSAPTTAGEERARAHARKRADPDMPSDYASDPVITTSKLLHDSFQNRTDGTRDDLGRAVE